MEYKGMSYKRYGNHWVVFFICSGEIFCHCDSEQEALEEIMAIKNV